MSSARAFPLSTVVLNNLPTESSQQLALDIAKAIQPGIKKHAITTDNLYSKTILVLPNPPSRNACLLWLDQIRQALALFCHLDLQSGYPMSHPPLPPDLAEQFSQAVSAVGHRYQRRNGGNPFSFRVEFDFTDADRRFLS